MAGQPPRDAISSVFSLSLSRLDEEPQGCRYPFVRSISCPPHQHVRTYLAGWLSLTGAIVRPCCNCDSVQERNCRPQHRAQAPAPAATAFLLPTRHDRVLHASGKTRTFLRSSIPGKPSHGVDRQTDRCRWIDTAIGDDKAPAACKDNGGLRPARRAAHRSAGASESFGRHGGPTDRSHRTNLPP